MLHLGIAFAEMERRLARERTLVGLERVKATGETDGFAGRELGKPQSDTSGESGCDREAADLG